MFIYIGVIYVFYKEVDVWVSNVIILYVVGIGIGVGFRIVFSGNFFL